MSNLSKETIERIEADAIAHVEKTRGQQGRVETYVAGALHEAERAQGLVDALEAIIKNWPVMQQAANALAKYKEVNNER